MKRFLLSLFCCVGLVQPIQAQYVKYFDTLNALLAANPNDRSKYAVVGSVNGTPIDAGATFKYEPTSATPTNTVAVFKPISYNGRWFRVAGSGGGGGGGGGGGDMIQAVYDTDFDSTIDIAAGGTEANTPGGARQSLGVPGLADENTFTDTNTFPAVYIGTTNAGVAIASKTTAPLVIGQKYTFAFEGDSITEHGTNSWPNYLSSITTNYYGNYVNNAASSDTAANMDATYAAQFGPHEPNTTGTNGWFFLLAGANSLADTPANLFGNISNIWRKARAGGFRVMAFTISPRADTGAPENNTRVSVNNAILASPDKYDALYRLDQKMPDPYDYQAVMADVVHPNAWLKKVIASEIADFLTRDSEAGKLSGPSYIINTNDPTVLISSGTNSIATSLRFVGHRGAAPGDYTDSYTWRVLGTADNDFELWEGKYGRSIFWIRRPHDLASPLDIGINTYPTVPGGGLDINAGLRASGNVYAMEDLEVGGNLTAQAGISLGGVMLTNWPAGGSGSLGIYVNGSAVSNANLTNGTGYTVSASSTNVTISLNTNLTDLVDGSLTGSKVGTGIDAGNITAGTITSNRLPASAVFTSLNIGTMTNNALTAFRLVVAGADKSLVSSSLTDANILSESEASTTYAPLASPALTGNPTAPNQALMDSDTSIANTAFALSNAVAQAALRQLGSANLTNWSSVATTAKADVASPTFTGNPAAPTATAGDNDTSIATTAFVTAAVAAGGGGGAVSNYAELYVGDLILTNAIAVPSGGTGLQTVTANALLSGNGTNALDLVTVGTGLSLSGTAGGARTLSATGSGTSYTNLTETNYTVTIRSNLVVNGTSSVSGDTNGSIRLNDGQTVEANSKSVVIRAPDVITNSYVLTLPNNTNANGYLKATWSTSTNANLAWDAGPTLDAELAQIAAITPSTGDILYFNGSEWARLAAPSGIMGVGATPVWNGSTLFWADSRNYSAWFDDFLANTGTSPWVLVGATGTASDTSMQFVFASSANGVLNVNCGTGSGHYAYAARGRVNSIGNVVLGRGRVVFGARVSARVSIGDSSNRQRYQIGLQSVVTSTNVPFGVWFDYYYGQNSQAWTGYTSTNSTQTASSLGSAISAATWYDLACDIAADGSSAVFYVDGTALATNSANMPIGTTTSSTHFVIKNFNVVGTTSVNHDLYTDNAWFSWFPSTNR